MKLNEFVTQNNQWSYIVVEAVDNKFEGKEIWDVMMSIGLKWGDMDIFHWKNQYYYGDDNHLSVWTSTDPGYFFPEEIAAGRVQTDNLVFGFSIPRSASPLEVFEVMFKISEYAKNRLGGKLSDEYGNTLNIDVERKKIERVINNLEIESIKAGFDDALYLFQ